MGKDDIGMFVNSACQIERANSAATRNEICWVDVRSLDRIVIL